MADFQTGYTNIEKSKDIPLAEYPLSATGNGTVIQNPQSYPTQQTPSRYDGQQYPTAVPQVVVQQQPQKVTTSKYLGEDPNSYIAFSITCLVLTALCGWPLLVCTIPSTILSVLSRNRTNRGDLEVAGNYGRWAFGLNMLASFGFGVIALVVIIYEIANSAS